MRIVEIIRLSSTMERGTLGVLRIDKQPFCVTLELPWRENLPFKSCIPPGQYHCEKYESSRYNETYIVLGVPERDGILWHPGNFLSDTDGCILPGTSFGHVEGKLLIRESVDAFNYFMNYLRPDNSFHLTITDCF